MAKSTFNDGKKKRFSLSIIKMRVFMRDTLWNYRFKLLMVGNTRAES